MQQRVKPGCYCGFCMCTRREWGKKTHSKACVSLQAFKFPSFISFGAFKYYLSLFWSPCCHSNFHSCSSYFNSSPISIIITRHKAHLRFTQKDRIAIFFVFVLFFFFFEHCDALCVMAVTARAGGKPDATFCRCAGACRIRARPGLLLWCCSSQIKLAAEPTWGITKRLHQWGNTAGRTGWLNDFDVASVIKGHYCVCLIHLCLQGATVLIKHCDSWWMSRAYWPWQTHWFHITYPECHNVLAPLTRKQSWLKVKLQNKPSLSDLVC